MSRAFALSKPPCRFPPCCCRTVARAVSATSACDVNMPLDRRRCFGYHRSMKAGPDIALVASLVGDPARSSVLAALMGGERLTASELALDAVVTPECAR